MRTKTAAAIECISIW